MKTCCVIGGTGFIGWHIVNSLVHKRKKIIVVARSSIPARSLPKGVEYIPGDFGDRYFLKKVLYGVDEVIDLAYASVPKTSYDNPVDDITSNLPPVVNLFEVAGLLGIEKVIIVSSGGVVYGHCTRIPIGEEELTRPVSPYGITKLAVENYARMFHVLKDLPVICIRPGNAYGEGQKPFVGQGFVATAIASILTGRKLSLFGRKGTVRDYIYVEDIASAIIAALNHGNSGDIYNVGTGQGKSNLDILEALAPFAEKNGLEIKLDILPERKFDVPVNILDSSKLIRETGWKVRVPFEDGIKRTWEWYEKNLSAEGVIRRVI